MKWNVPLITLKIMLFRTIPLGAVSHQWQHWSICLVFPCRSNLWVSLSHHLIKVHLQLGDLSSLSRHLNVKLLRERKMRENVLMHRVINWSAYVDNYIQVGKSKRFGEKKPTLFLKGLIKSCLSCYFSKKNKSWLLISSTRRCLQGKNNSWITRAGQRSSVLLFLPQFIVSL